MCDIGSKSASNIKFYDSLYSGISPHIEFVDTYVHPPADKWDRLWCMCHCICNSSVLQSESCIPEIQQILSFPRMFQKLRLYCRGIQFIEVIEIAISIDASLRTKVLPMILED